MKGGNGRWPMALLSFNLLCLLVCVEVIDELTFYNLIKSVLNFLDIVLYGGRKFSNGIFKSTCSLH